MRDRFYKPELDALRFFAFLMVFIAHAAPDPAAWARLGLPSLGGIANAGIYGVDLFFALSAYLITAILLREKDRTGKIHVGRFYGRRILRIWPLYFLMLALTPLLHHLGSDLPAPYLLAFLFFVGNWACAFWGYPPSVITPLWSVSIEEQFYLLWPFVLRLRGLPWVLAGIFVIASAAQFHLRHEVHPGIWCNTFARLQPIAVGAALALIPERKSNPAFFLAALLAFVLCGMFGSTEGARAILTYPVVALASGVLVAHAPKIRTPALLYLGRISYGLYVFHALALGVILRHGITHSMGTYTVRVLGAGMLTLALAALSYRFLESPFLKLKERISLITTAPSTNHPKLR